MSFMENMRSLFGWSGGSSQAMTAIQRSLEFFGDTEEFQRANIAMAVYLGDPYALDETLKPFESEVERDEGGRVSVSVPLWKRRPSILACEGRKVINRAQGLLVGKGRFPLLEVVGKDEKVNKEATKALAGVLRAVKFRRMWQSAVRRGLVQGAFVVAMYLVDGELYPKPYSARDCIPTFGWDDRDTARAHGIRLDDLVKLRIRRIYKEKDSSGTEVDMLFVKDLEPNRTVEYHPIRADMVIDGRPLELREKQVDEHGLGFVPAVWVSSDEADDSPWGPGLLDGVETMLFEIDYQLSQMARACRYHGDPALSPISAEAQESIGDLSYLEKGATRVLPFAAHFVEMQGSGQEQQRKLIEDLRQQVQEVTQIFYPQLGDRTSGTAFSAAAAPTVSRIDELREVAESGICESAAKALRMASKAGKVDLGGLGLKDGEWTVTATWPPISLPSEEDIFKAAQALAVAVGAEILSHETAVAFLLARFGSPASGAEEFDRVMKERAARIREALAAAGPDGEAIASTLKGAVGAGATAHPAGEKRSPKDEAFDGAGAAGSGK